MAWAGTLVFGAQFLYIGGAAIFVVDLLGEGELDFWKLFVPMIGAMVVGSVAAAVGWAGWSPAPGWCPSATPSARRGRAAGHRRRPDAGRRGAAVGGRGGRARSRFGNGLAFPNIQLLMLDLVPTRRGAVMSAASFVTLVFNAASAALLAPYAGRSVLGFAVAAAVCVVLGWACWRWHLSATRAAHVRA